MSDSWKGRHAFAARRLLVAARWLVFLPIILSTVLLTAGTFLYHNPYRPMTEALGFSSLSMVSYDGIVTTNRKFTDYEPNFLFRLHWFPNAFGWECPYCPPVVYSPRGFVRLAGVQSSGPRVSFEPVEMMRGIAALAQLPRGSWDCRALDQHDLDTVHCREPFFEAWRRSYVSRFRVFPAYLGFVMYILAIVSALTTLVSEFLITYQPHMMKCRCLMLKRYCPCPKGSNEEIEALDENFWDGQVRLYYYGATAVFFFLAALHDTITPLVFISHIEYINQFLPKGVTMAARQNASFLVLVWTMVGLAGVALLCIRIRSLLTTQRKGWMDQQDLDDVIEPGLQQEGDAEIYDDALPPGEPYRDEASLTQHLTPEEVTEQNSNTS